MYVIEEGVWSMLSVHLPYRVYMHGAVMVPYDGRVIVFGGLEESDMKTGKVAVVNFTTQTAGEVESMLSAGCITDEVRVIGKSVLVMVFYGYASRQLNRLDLTTFTWELLR